MPIEKSAGAIIFRREGNEIKYLLLHYPSSAKAAKDYWDFPKGHIEKGEKKIDTIIREIAEETGIKDLKFIEGFKETEKYFFKHEGKTIFKTVFYLLAETKTPYQNKYGTGQAPKDVKISEEHIGYKWLPYEKAIKQLGFKNAKEILEKANNYLLKCVT